jgi:heat-inducible transcriptional repressor
MQFTQQSRNKAILHSIVEAYIASGEPVASRTISRVGGSTLSAATIRNVMADLVDEGFLAQPHTSAGRVPTAKAFESYVQVLTNKRLGSADYNRVRAELRMADTVEAKVECSSHLLTELTRNVGIAAVIPLPSQTLLHVELVALSDNRVLMVVETNDRMVRNRVVDMHVAVKQDELNSIRNYVNENFSGWKLSDIRRELENRTLQESAQYDAILSNLELFYQKGLLDMGSAPEVHLEGAANLVAGDMPITREKMRELFRTLEEKRRLIELLDRFLDTASGEVSVKVGLREIHSSLEDLSLIGFSVNLPSGLTAKVAVLGPLRMNYAQVVSAVMHVGETLESL